MTGAARAAPVLFVIAGVNGAGKSSLGGARLRQLGLDYYNPDEAAKSIQELVGGSLALANAAAWHEGKRRLEAAIANRASFAFETTLGGRTMPSLLRGAAEAGFEVIVWFLGLSSAEQHLARIRARVAAGGHPIPEETVRERWDASRRNLIALLPHLSELKLFDNSREANAATGRIPPPRLLLHWRRGRIVAPERPLSKATPDWAKPIIAGALQLLEAPG